MRVRTLTPSYAGYLEAYNPYSTDTARLVGGVAGDVVEILSTWEDMKTHTTWHLVRLSESRLTGWLLDHETVSLVSL